MIKNFEAMACGCVLLAWSQGEEDRLLGFEDMENTVFYRSEDEAVQKLELLQRDPELAARIARNGQAFAESRYSLRVSGGCWPRKSSGKCVHGKPLRYSLADGSSCVTA